MSRHIQNIIAQQKNGKIKGIYSICSAHPWVLKAAFGRAKTDNSYLLIEATSNQVNQFGGYTGMTPKDFTAYVNKIAVQLSFPQEKIILGGDHLGPNSWQDELAASALIKANVLVSDCVKAGFRKIHLDASMPLADDLVKKGEPLDDEIVAARAADMCAAAEAAFNSDPVGDKPVYVIGTEVPIPGGAQNGGEELSVTSVEAVTKTIEITKKIFTEKGLGNVWERVIAVVVQPGVEFGDSEIIDYNRTKAKPLSDFIKPNATMTFEAHSTDYQTKASLCALVEDQFGILKVGPWLTFAFREAVYALSKIEKEILSGKEIEQASFVQEKLDEIMVTYPGYWKKYYSGNEEELLIARKYSLSDRSRYYWGNPFIEKEFEKLLSNLNTKKIPLSLLSQYMPHQYLAIRNGEIANSPEALILNKIDEVIQIYSVACRSREN